MSPMLLVHRTTTSVDGEDDQLNRRLLFLSAQNES